MDLDPQTLFNAILLIGSGMVGLLVAILRESLKALREQYHELDKSFQDHKNESARNNVTRGELDGMAVRIFAKLDEMQRELRQDIKELASSKADK